MALEEDFQDMSRTLLFQALARERSSASMLRVLNELDARVDDAAATEAQSCEPPIACRIGCDHCCHQVVYARMTDVVRATDYVRTVFLPDELRTLKERLYAYERAVAPYFGLNPRQARAPCPFLLDGRCSIYPARPNRCRAMNSTDAAVCEQIKGHPTEESERPECADYSKPALDIVRGVSQALASHGYAHGAVDFGRAIAIALGDPAAIEDFFAGGYAFAPALLRQPISKQPKVAGKEPYYPSYAPGEEAKGEISLADMNLHYERFTEGDTEGALAALTGKHPANLIRKIIAPMIYRSDDEVEYWRGHFEKAVDRLGEADFDSREAFDALLGLGTFELAYQQNNVRPILEKLGRILVERIATPCFPDLSRPIEGGRKPGRVRVGYISENLTSSNGGSWALGWLKNHSEQIETYAFCLSEAPDSITQRFRAHADHFFNMRGNVAANARTIRELDLDALIYTDIGMSGRNYQYATMRLARRQFTAWGHPVTSGLPTIDFYLSSGLMEPKNGQDHYSEELMRLPHSGLCYPRSPVPASRMVRSDFGLDAGPLYLSCQNPMKYLPRWDFLYREICERTGRPIVFVEGPLPMEKKMLRDRMANAGINAIWLPGLSPSDFLALIQLADCCLDTPGWNGGNTTISALTAGTPVVTMPGEFMRGRHSLAFNTLAGVEGLVAAEPAEYVEAACDLERLREAMTDLNADALYDDLAPVRALDALLLG